MKNQMNVLKAHATDPSVVVDDLKYVRNVLLRVNNNLPWRACLIPDSGVFELKLFNVAFDKLVISPTARIHGERM